MTMQQDTATSAAKRLALTSVFETISFLVLLAMMIAKSEAGVSVAGAIHGVLFLAYALLVLKDRDEFGWTPTFVAVAILTGPLGAILVLERLRRR